MLQVSVFEHLHLSSALGSSGRPGITSLEVFLQLSEDKQQQQEAKKKRTAQISQTHIK
jgi:hypothetical protein